MGSAEKARNKADKLAVRAKEKIGRATGNQRIEDRGRVDRVRASLRAGLQTLKAALGR